MRSCLQASLSCNYAQAGQVKLSRTTCKHSRQQRSRKSVFQASNGPASEKSVADSTTGPTLLNKPARHHVSKRTRQCPACGQSLSRPHTLEKHFQTCCPDLISAEAWKAAKDNDEATVALIAAAAEAELQLRRDCISIAFRQVDSDGQPIKRSPEEVADIMNLPASRVRGAFKIAQKGIPLVADPDPVAVIYEDDDIIAVNKPAGIISAPKHRFAGGSMVNRIIGYLGYAPYPVHRLDMFTSGVLVMAKRQQAAAPLALQFSERTAKKSYLAISSGAPHPDVFSVDALIDRHPTEQIARAILPSGDASYTDFKVISSHEAVLLENYTYGLVASEATNKTRGAALVVAMPRTGRTHQVPFLEANVTVPIRVHLAHAGHAILGDEVYGLKGPWISRQALHAALLRLQHPMSKEPLQLIAPVPDDMAAAAAMLELAIPDAATLKSIL